MKLGHRYSVHALSERTESPWPLAERLRMQMWEICWRLLCAWTPKPLCGWRLFWLRAFGAQLDGRPFVHSRARIQKPWNLRMHDLSTLGDRANAYTQGKIEIGPRATVAQEAYLCTGTHDFDNPALPLLTAPIVVEADAFIGARAFIMPGVTIGEGAIIGAAAVITEDVPAWTVWAGNPARLIRHREKK